MYSAKQQKELTQKITIHISKQLLREAQKVSHENITQTIADGLHLLVEAKAAENLRKMRGKVKFSINVAELREDR